MKYYTSLLIVALLVTSCGYKKPEATRIEKYTVVRTFKKTPISIHDEMSPRYRAVLTNGDTVACGERCKSGDTITFEYYGTR